VVVSDRQSELACVPGELVQRQLSKGRRKSQRQGQGEGEGEGKAKGWVGLLEYHADVKAWAQEVGEADDAHGLGEYFGSITQLANSGQQQDNNGQEQYYLPIALDNVNPAAVFLHPQLPRKFGVAKRNGDIRPDVFEMSVSCKPFCPAPPMPEPAPENEPQPAPENELQPVLEAEPEPVLEAEQEPVQEDEPGKRGVGRPPMTLKSFTRNWRRKELANMAEDKRKRFGPPAAAWAVPAVAGDQQEDNAEQQQQQQEAGFGGRTVGSAEAKRGAAGGDDQGVAKRQVRASK
jgi:hypothetical protein